VLYTPIAGRKEFFALLGCYAAFIGRELPTFRDKLSVAYLRSAIITTIDRIKSFHIIYS